MANLAALASDINREHLACGKALQGALGHALEAGRLLGEAKAALPHGAFGPWVEANFEGSKRTARAYIQLWRDKAILEAKRQSSATLSIARALEALVEPPKGLPPIPDRNVPFDHPTPPAQEAEERISDADYVLSSVAALLGGAQAPELALRPEEAVEALRRMPRKDRNRRTEVLREGVAWLERVLEEAEARHGVRR